MTVLTRARTSLAQIWVAYLAVGTIFTVAYLFAPHLKGNGPLINLLGLSSSLAIVAGVLMHKPRAWVAWLLLACGQLLFFAGDVYTYSYPKLFHHDVPFPSPGDWLPGRLPGADGRPVHAGAEAQPARGPSRPDRLRDPDR